ncbi:hypothetical protein DPMN_186912 [Dreissena polymorpha]|uniref:Uncharacterized protein n=1 Tax=Dreissena polymorpha TaxID=45954 RepID=A0A9D4DP52_DREPO|nr:hypothetical protein DPMN_186912 [Dreissena polymorpha]
MVNQTTVLEGTAGPLLPRTTITGLMFHVVASSSQFVNSSTMNRLSLDNLQ